MPIFIEREHLHGDVARCGILFEVIEDGPTQHVREEDIERYRGGLILTRECQGIATGGSHQDLEALVARKIAEDPRIVRIVFDDQENGVALGYIGAIICNAGFLFDGSNIR